MSARNTRKQGKLVRWKRDRGFGFIRSEGDGTDIFIHISAFPRTGREPQVGDTIFYVPQMQSDGRLQAVSARIAGVEYPTGLPAARGPARSTAATHSPTASRHSSVVRQQRPLYDARPLVVSAGILFFVMAGLTFAIANRRQPTVSTAQARSSSPPAAPREVPAATQPPSTAPSASPAPQATPTPAPSPTPAPATAAPTPQPIPEPAPIAADPAPAALGGCVIKGNISQNSGRKLYHVPGMEDYNNTIIRREDGERYFCSEAEAQAAGWVRAPR